MTGEGAVIIGLLFVGWLIYQLTIGESMRKREERRRELMGSRRYPLADVSTAIDNAQRLGYRYFWLKQAAMPMDLTETRRELKGWTGQQVVLEMLPRTPEAPYDRLAMKMGKAKREGYEIKGCWTKVDLSRNPISRMSGGVGAPEDN